MSRSRSAWYWCLTLVLPLLVSACVEDVETTDPPTGRVEAVFSLDTDPPQVPTPTDLARNPQTGLLEVPVADATKQPAQAYFDAFLNTLDGYPTTATAELFFAGEIDPKSVTKDSVVVVDVTDATKPARVDGLIFEVDVLDGEGGAKRSRVRIWNPAGWNRGSTYAFFVLGKGGVQDASGQPVIRSTFFELAANDSPLCAWEPTYAWDAQQMECQPAAEGETGTGCCTFNYSALIETSVRAELAEQNPDLSYEEFERLAEKAVLASATDLEQVRRGVNQLLEVGAALSVPRDDVVVAWSFTTVSMNQAVFNPAARPPQVPTPTDLVRDPATGFLAIPTAEDASPAEKEFNAFLNSLDGYPTNSSGSLSFTGDLVESTAPDGILVFEVDTSGGTPQLIQRTNVTVSYDAETDVISVVPKPRFKRATSFVLLAVADSDKLANPAEAKTDLPKRTALMHLTLSPHPLCTYDTSANQCTDSKISSFIDDPDALPGALTGVEKATSFEQIRRTYRPLLEGATQAANVAEEDVIALWAFTTTSLTELIYDPTVGEIPFPNDVLLDQSTGKVNIPPALGETPGEKALREGLNTLDGFTTQGGYFVSYNGSLDESSVVYGPTGILGLDLDAGAPVGMRVSKQGDAAAIYAVPSLPLAEKTQHGLIMVSKMKEGSLESQGGLKDEQGNRLIPSTFMALARNRHPLYDADKDQSLISTVDAATAKQVETLRAALKPMFDSLDSLFNLKREDIVVAWTFKTQTISDPLVALRAAVWGLLGAADSNAPTFQGTLDPTLTGWPATAPSSALGGWVPDGQFTTWIALDESGTQAFLTDPTQGQARQVPFFMTVPSGTMPAAGWPVVVFQHGITRSKVDIFAVANTLAQAGFATIAFDTIYHGDRTWCTEDADCAASGTCDVATGQCSTDFADNDADGVPDASGGARFLNTDNPFAIRDNIRQHVLDASALLRAISLGAASGITGSVTLDTTNVQLAGNSLGGMLTTLVLAVDSLPARGVLTVPGAPEPDIYLGMQSSPAFKQTKQDVLAGMGIQEGSLEYLRLLTTFNWILDPASAGNFARYVLQQQLTDAVTSAPVPKKQVLMMLATDDQVIPKTPFGDYLSTAMFPAADKDTFTEVYTGQGHGLILGPSPDAAATAAAQTQMATFLATGTVCTPNLTTGTCN